VKLSVGEKISPGHIFLRLLGAAMSLSFYRRSIKVKVKVKVKFNLEQGTKTQRGSRGKAVLFI
jgi:hypothetical protein